MIIPPDQRITKLLNAEVPKCFLEALDNLKRHGDMQFLVRPPDAAYFYLPQIYHQRKTLADFDIIPICDSLNGDAYYALLSKGLERQFVYFSLEVDGILKNYGSDFRLLLADLLIYLYELSEDDLPTLATIGRKLGFEKSEHLFQALYEADKLGTRRTFESDSIWRDSHIPIIIG